MRSHQGNDEWGFGAALLLIGAIFAVGAAALPAIQHQREEMRRIQCKNDLKQISISVSRYTPVSVIARPQ
jgi:hypothetical protein